MTIPSGRPWSPRLVITVALVVASAGVACDTKDRKAVAVAAAELAELKSPDGMFATDERVELGEMDAFGTQTYCVGGAKEGQAALDSMLRNAGWEPVSSSTTADASLWNYRKGGLTGVLRLETQAQPCGRRFVVSLVKPL